MAPCWGSMASIGKIKKEFITSMNFPTKINPGFYLNVEEIDIDN